MSRFAGWTAAVAPAPTLGKIATISRRAGAERAGAFGLALAGVRRGAVRLAFGSLGATSMLSGNWSTKAGLSGEPGGCGMKASSAVATVAKPKAIAEKAPIRTLVMSAVDRLFLRFIPAPANITWTPGQMKGCSVRNSHEKLQVDKLKSTEQPTLIAAMSAMQ